MSVETVGWPDEPLASFVQRATRYIEDVTHLADTCAQEQPGTAQLLQAIAERHAGDVLDIVSCWPS